MVDTLSYFSFQPMFLPVSYELSCLWDGAYEISHAVNRKRVAMKKEQ